jgi:hypothetical protein
VRKDINALIRINVFVKASTVIDISIVKQEIDLIGITLLKKSNVVNSYSMIFELHISFLHSHPVYRNIKDLLAMEIYKQVLVVKSLSQIEFDLIDGPICWL